MTAEIDNAKYKNGKLEESNTIQTFEDVLMITTCTENHIMGLTVKIKKRKVFIPIDMEKFNVTIFNK